MYDRLEPASKIVSEIQCLEMVKFTEIDRRLRRRKTVLKVVATLPGQAINSVRTYKGMVICAGTVPVPAAQGGDSRPANLCRNPQTLSIPWSEYMNRIGGRKSTQQFTQEDRGVGVK